MRLVDENGAGTAQRSELEQLEAAYRELQRRMGRRSVGPGTGR